MQVCEGWQGLEASSQTVFKPFLPDRPHVMVPSPRHTISLTASLSQGQALESTKWFFEWQG